MLLFKPMRRVTLNVRTVASLKALEGHAKTYWWDRMLPGFYLCVSPPSPRYAAGVRSYGLVYRVRGRQRRASLGRHPVVGLGAARERARAILEAARVRGVDLLNLPQEGLDLAGLVDRWLEATAAQRQPRTVREYRRLMDRHVAKERAARIPLVDLRRADVRDMLAPLAATAPTTAVNVHRRIRSAMRWGMREELIDRDPTAALDPPAILTSRERVLSDRELVALWRATEDEERSRRPAVGRQRAALARLLILLAQRSGETAAMRWADLDIPGRVWLIPAEHRKGPRGKRKAHAVTLTEQALAVLEWLRPLTGRDERVMPWSHATHRHWVRPLVLRAEARGLVERWTPHDLRRTAATGMGRIGVSRSAIALVLGHEMREGGAVTATYDRYDRMGEKTAALTAWGEYVGQLVAAS